MRKIFVAAICVFCGNLLSAEHIYAKSMIPNRNNSLVPIIYPLLLNGEAYVQPSAVILDDYRGETNSLWTWYYTRIGTDRGKIGPESAVTLKGKTSRVDGNRLC